MEFRYHIQNVLFPNCQKFASFCPQATSLNLQNLWMGSAKQVTFLIKARSKDKTLRSSIGWPPKTTQVFQHVISAGRSQVNLSRFTSPDHATDPWSLRSVDWLARAECLIRSNVLSDFQIAFLLSISELLSNTLYSVMCLHVYHTLVQLRCAFSWKCPSCEVS